MDGGMQQRTDGSGRPYDYYLEPELYEGEVIFLHTSADSSTVYRCSGKTDDGYTFVNDADASDVIQPQVSWVNNQEESPFVFDEKTDTCEEEFYLFIYQDGTMIKSNICTATVFFYDDDDDDDDDGYDFEDIDPAGSYATISEGEIKTVRTQYENTVTYRFSPNEDGTFVFQSFSDPETDPDPVGRVVYIDEKTGEPVVAAYNDDTVYSDDGHFQMVFETKAGRVYYLQTGAWDEETVSFSVELYKTADVKGIDLVLVDHEDIPTLTDGVYMDDDDPKIFDYEKEDLFEPGDKVYLFYEEGLTVSNLSGKTLGEDYDIYTADDELIFKNNEGKTLTYSLVDTQEDTYWTPGNDPYFITFVCMGHEDADTLKVIIRENPVKSISFTPKFSDNNGHTIKYFSDEILTASEDNPEYKYYDLSKRGFYSEEMEKYEGFVNGDILRVTFKDGSAVNYTYDREIQDFINGEDILPLCSAEYELNTWDMYADEYQFGDIINDAVSVEYAGKTIQLDAKIVKGTHPHDWGAWDVISQPSTTQEGLRKHTCRYCGVTATESIAKLAPPAPVATAKQELQDLKPVKGLKIAKGKGKLTVKWKKADKKLKKTIQGYEIQYTQNGTFTDYAPKKLGKGKASAALKKLAKKSNYTVRIRCYRDDGSVLHVSAWRVKRAKTK